MSQKTKLDNLTPEDRSPYSLKAAEMSGKPAHILEKDFWVCWTLARLFEIDGVKDHS